MLKNNTDYTFRVLISLTFIYMSAIILAMIYIFTMLSNLCLSPFPKKELSTYSDFQDTTWIQIINDYYEEGKIQIDTSNFDERTTNFSYFILCLVALSNNDINNAIYYNNKLEQNQAVIQSNIRYLKRDIIELKNLNLEHSIDSLNQELKEINKSVTITVIVPPNIQAKKDNIKDIPKSEDSIYSIPPSIPSVTTPKPSSDFPFNSTFCTGFSVRTPNSNVPNISNTANIKYWASTFNDIEKINYALEITKKSIQYYDNRIQEDFINKLNSGASVNGMRGKYKISDTRNGDYKENLVITLNYDEATEYLFTANSATDKLMRSYTKAIKRYGIMNEVDYRNIPYHLEIVVYVPQNYKEKYNGELGKTLFFKTCENNSYIVEKNQKLAIQEIAPLIAYQYIKGFEKEKLYFTDYVIMTKKSKSKIISVEATIMMNSFLLRDYYYYQQINEIEKQKVEALEKRLIELGGK